jgi:hypothetical protein
LVCKGLLHRVDGEQGEIWFSFCMVEEVDVDQLLDFDIRTRNIFDDGREILGTFFRLIQKLIMKRILVL